MLLDDNSELFSLGAFRQVDTFGSVPTQDMRTGGFLPPRRLGWERWRAADGSQVEGYVRKYGDKIIDSKPRRIRHMDEVTGRWSEWKHIDTVERAMYQRQDTARNEARDALMEKLDEVKKELRDVSEKLDDRIEARINSMQKPVVKSGNGIIVEGSPDGGYEVGLAAPPTDSDNDLAIFPDHVVVGSKVWDKGDWTGSATGYLKIPRDGVTAPSYAAAIPDDGDSQWETAHFVDLGRICIDIMSP